MPRRRKKKLDFGDIIGQSIIRNNDEDWVSRYRRMTAISSAFIGTVTATYTTATTAVYVPFTYVNNVSYNTGNYTYTLL